MYRKLLEYTSRGWGGARTPYREAYLNWAFGWQKQVHRDVKVDVRKDEELNVVVVRRGVL